jgi:two-component system response regulator AtoC
LRERKEDIPLLAEHFLRQQLKSSAKNISGFHPRVMELFERYDWPGNVRELENIIEHAISFSKNEVILPNDLPAAILKTEPVPFDYQPATALSLAEAKNRAIEEVEKAYLLKLLKEYHGNVTKISEVAQMTRRNLYRLMNRYGLAPESWRNSK